MLKDPKKREYKKFIAPAVVVLAAIGIGLGGYEYFLMSLEMNRNTANLEGKILELESKNISLARELKVEQQKNGAFESQIGQIAGTVGTLNKLAKTDKELLQKYSKVYFLNENYVPKGLIEIPQQYVYEKNKKIQILASTSNYLLAMMDDAKKIFLLTKISETIKLLLSKFNAKIKNKINAYYSRSEECECLQGCCMLFRRDNFEKLNGFDESVPMYLDDIDICYRNRKRGLRNYYLAESEIVHIGQHSTRKSKHYKYYDVLAIESHLFYYKKHFGKKAVRLYKLLLILSVPYLLILDLISLPFFIFKRKLNDRFWVFKKHVKYIEVIVFNHIRLI